MCAKQVRQSAAQLSPEEFALIESYLSRRSGLDFGVRLRLAEEILRRIKPKLTLPADPSLTTDRLLETLGMNGAPPASIPETQSRMPIPQA